MNFSSLYNQIHTQKIRCQFHKRYDVQKIMVGSGGSQNLILSMVDKQNNFIIAKIMPRELFDGSKKLHKDYEIKFYQFLTKKFILTNRTPHIVGIYNHQICGNLHNFLTNIAPAKLICPSYEDKLQKKITQEFYEISLCDILLKTQMKIIDSKFDIVFLESCGADFGYILYRHMHDFMSAKKSNWPIVMQSFINDFDRILFQIIFTLAIIQKDYPGFLHGDLFIRNLLVSTEKQFKESEFVAYHYGSIVFYLPANGLYVKMNDFGLSRLQQLTKYVQTDLQKKWDIYHHINSFNHKTDIFNLLHDIYDGEQLGSHSLMGFARQYRLSPAKIIPIRNLMRKYIDIKTIDKINKNNSVLLGNTWHIDKLPLLENTVMTPDEYLKSGIFKQFLKLSTESTIVRSFNEST